MDHTHKSASSQIVATQDIHTETGARPPTNVNIKMNDGNVRTEPTNTNETQDGRNK